MLQQPRGHDEWLIGAPTSLKLDDPFFFNNIDDEWHIDQLLLNAPCAIDFSSYTVITLTSYSVTIFTLGKIYFVHIPSCISSHDQ